MAKVGFSSHGRKVSRYFNGACQTELVEADGRDLVEADDRANLLFVLPRILWRGRYRLPTFFLGWQPYLSDSFQRQRLNLRKVANLPTKFVVEPFICD
jgi:hypothetical protein